MAFRICIWTDELIDHLAQHDLTPEDFEDVLSDPIKRTFSRKTGLPAAIGYTADGRRIICIYEEIDDVYVLPRTAYEIGDRR